MSEEQVYTHGEASLLMGLLNSELKKWAIGTCPEVFDLYAILKFVVKNLRSLSDGYSGSVIKRLKISRYGNLDELVRVLFKEKLDRMPLLINKPVIGVIAQFRLQVGR